MLQYYLVSKGYGCELISVENEDAIRYDCDLLGFASPVYGGYPAKIMMDFIERSETDVHKVPAFIVLCPCSTLGYWGSREVFIDVLSAKNIQVIADLGFLGTRAILLSLARLSAQNPFYYPSLTELEGRTVLMRLI